jgi:hypothetical protein
MISKEELKKKARQEVTSAFNLALAWIDVCEREVALYNNISDMLKYSEQILGAMKFEEEHNKFVQGDQDDE